MSGSLRFWSRYGLHHVKLVCIVQTNCVGLLIVYTRFAWFGQSLLLVCMF